MKTIFRQFDTFTNGAERGINLYLHDNPDAEVKHIYMIVIGYAGGEQCPGVLVEFRHTWAGPKEED